MGHFDVVSIGFLLLLIFVQKPNTQLRGGRGVGQLWTKSNTNCDRFLSKFILASQHGLKILIQKDIGNFAQDIFDIVLRKLEKVPSAGKREFSSKIRQISQVPEKVPGRK